MPGSPGSNRAKRYANADGITVEQAKTRIAKILSEIDSRDNAVSSKELAEIVGLKATTVRDLIPEIRENHDLPIVACPKGYYQISSVDQLERELERIDGEIETRQKRRKELCKAYNRKED